MFTSDAVLTWWKPAAGKLLPDGPLCSEGIGSGALDWPKSGAPLPPLLLTPLLLRRIAALPGVWNRLGGVAAAKGPLGEAAWFDEKLPAPGLQHTFKELG